MTTTIVFNDKLKDLYLKAFESLTEQDYNTLFYHLETFRILLGIDDREYVENQNVFLRNMQYPQPERTHMAIIGLTRNFAMLKDMLKGRGVIIEDHR